MKQIETNRIEWWLSILLILISLILIFFKLGDHVIYMWDEAVYVNNALEMAHFNNWWVIQNDGLPSHYNVKPPLATWLQALSIKIFGPSEWALRLPSVLAGMGIFALIIFYTRKWTNHLMGGALAIFILASCLGFNRPHIIQTADLDGILLLFTTWYSLKFIDYLWAENQEKNFHWHMMALVFCAFLTKSLAGLMPLLPLFLLALFIKNGKVFLSSKKSWLAIAIGILLIVFYYIIRNLTQPGFFELVWNSEFLRFTHNVMEWHTQPFTFYIMNMWSLEYFYPHFVLFILPIFALFTSTAKTKNLNRTLLICAFLFLMLISIPKVKLLWYDAHIYPLLACTIAVSTIDISNKSLRWLGMIFIILVGTFASYRLISSRLDQRSTDSLEYAGEMINQLSRSHPEQKSYSVLMRTPHEEHLDQMKFYLKRNNWHKGYNIGHIDNLQNIKIGDFILCCQKDELDQLNKQFQLEPKETTEKCSFIQILSRKNE